MQLPCSVSLQSLGSNSTCGCFFLIEVISLYFRVKGLRYKVFPRHVFFSSWLWLLRYPDVGSLSVLVVFLATSHLAASVLSP